LLQAGDGDPDLLDRTRTMMGRQVDQLVRLVDDLMDVGRISSGTIVLRRGRIDLADAVGSAVESSRPAFAERRQELELRLPDEPITLDADQTRLAQVFTNLLDNASKYSHRRGRIWLEAVPGEGGVTITVRDEGIGIAAEHLPFVFDLFSQVDSRHARSNSGLGIGLSLVRRIVELHGGTIEVSSGGLGEGSECTVRLPLGSSVRSAPEPRQDDRVVPAYASLRILIIDDNEDHADSCNVLLRRRGHEVRTAYDGERGIAAALEFQPQVVLLDIGLPDVDGYEVCRRLQQEAGCRDATLIAISGWGQDDDRRRSREVGFHHHLVKPVAPLELDALLASLSVALGAH
jgi:CheY-like chemotaxis protein